MNNQTNNENLSQGTNGQPDEYSAYRDEEYERMRIEMEKRRAERRAREHRRVMKKPYHCHSNSFGDNFCDSESL